MSPDAEAFRLASEVEREHGDAAELFVAARIADAAKAGDQEQLGLWMAVRDTVSQLHRIARPPSTPYCASYDELAIRPPSAGFSQSGENSGQGPG